MRIALATEVAMQEQCSSGVTSTRVVPSSRSLVRVNNPTLCEFCFTMIGRADIEESKSGVAMNAWPPQASSRVLESSGHIDLGPKTHTYILMRP